MSERITARAASRLRGEVAITRISPLVLLLFAMLGCGTGSQLAKPTAATGDNQAHQQKVAKPEKQVALPAEQTSEEKIPDATTVLKTVTPEQLELGEPITNSVGMVLVPIPAGEFEMGSLELDSNPYSGESPQHLVKITKPFYLSVCEVTQEQYEKVMRLRPWHYRKFVREGPNYPATYVNWDDAVEFCRKLGEQEGVEYRLPTEAQWEYACRAGTTSAYNFGDDASKLRQYAWYIENSWEIGEQYPHRVGQKEPNPWGLHDMQGNACEWCQDRFGEYGSEKVRIDPAGPASGEGRVLRGGGFTSVAVNCRSAARDVGSFYDFPFTSLPNDYINGFRVTRTYP